MKGKKSLEAKTLVWMIIVLICFAIIVIFIPKLLQKEEIDREACHQSVIIRTLPIVSDIPSAGTKTTIPLNCKTEKITINYKDEDEIKERIANAMYDCWYMLGEGELDFFVRPLGPAQTYCIICSKISFEENIRDKYNKITDFPNYLKDTKISGKDETYSDWFGVDETFSDNDFENQAIDTKKDYMIIFSMTEKSKFALTGYEATGCLMSLAIAAKVGVATATVPVVGIYLAPFTGITTFVAGCGSSIWGAKGTDKWITGGESYISSLNLIPFDSKGIEKLQCDYIESIP